LNRITDKYFQLERILNLNKKFQKVFTTILLLHSFNTILFSQNQKGEFRKDIFIENYKISIVNKEVDYFTGGITVSDKLTNKDVFIADNIYTTYNSDTLIDLNNDGSKELIIDLATGATMYDYNMFLIFDFKKVSEPFKVRNAELITGNNEQPKILSNVRLSPSALGAGYSYILKYENSEFVLDKDFTNSKALKDIAPVESDDLYLINEYKKEFNECSSDSDFKIYFEAKIIQQKFIGKEKNGWKFFDKYYRCKNKNVIKKELKKSVDENYLEMNNPENFIFKK